MKVKILFFIIFLLSFFSCKNKNSITQIENIYIPKTISSVPIMELEGTKINKKNIKTTFYQDHITTFAQLLNGEINVVVTGFNLGVSGYVNSKKIVHVATYVWGVSSLITGKNNNDLNSIEDFKGKTITTPFAKSPLDLQLRAIIKYYNLDDKIKINYATLQQSIPLLIHDKTDGVCVPEPIASKLVSQGFNRVFNFKDYWKLINEGEPKSPQVSIFVRKDFAENNKDFCLALIKELDKKIKYLKGTNNYPQKYLNVFELDENIFKEAMNNTLFEIVHYEKSRQLCNNLLDKIEYQEEINDDFYLKGY